MKINTATIDGYDTMTTEQKLAALEAFEYDDHSADVERYKNATSKANSEAAEWKRKHNALLSEDEQRKQASEEELNNLRNTVAELQQRERMANYKSKYAALGYTDEQATKCAKALAEGKFDDVFDIQKSFMEAHDRDFKASLLSNTPQPIASNNPASGVTKEMLQKMSAGERYKFSIEHSEEYKKIYGD